MHGSIAVDQGHGGSAYGQAASQHCCMVKFTANGQFTWLHCGQVRGIVVQQMVSLHGFIDDGSIAELAKGPLMARLQGSSTVGQLAWLHG